MHLRNNTDYNFSQLTHWNSRKDNVAKGTFHFTIYNVTFGKSKMADVDMFGS